MNLAKFFCFCVLLALSSTCSNEFVVIDEWRNIPVVYGLLANNTEYNYIRVEKAFVDPDEGALVLAQRPDSLYYDNAIVQLERVSNGNRITLEKINAEDVGFEREEGVFATSPNILYRFKNEDFVLENDEEVRLIVIDGNTEQTLTEATTKIVGEYEIKTPRDPMTFRYEAPFIITFGADEKQARFYDIYMKIHYEEQDPNDLTEWIEKELLWVIEQGFERKISGGDTPAETTALDFKGIKFYEFLKQNIEPTSLIRRMKGIDVIVDAGGTELFNYVNVGSANTGITSNQIIPSYTNLSEGQGIFSSRSRAQVLDYNISALAQDSLINGVITKELNFQ